jgi:hypothetical protein
VLSGRRLVYERRRDLGAAIKRLTEQLRADRETLGRQQRELAEHSGRGDALEADLRDLTAKHSRAAPCRGRGVGRGLTRRQRRCRLWRRRRWRSRS